MAQTGTPFSILAVHEAKIQKLQTDLDNNNKSIVSTSLLIANKWRLADTGDDWLRIFDSNGGTYYGGLATDQMWTRKFLINSKWLLSDTLNDDWLRLYNANGSDYFGGFAAQKLWTPELYFPNGLKLKSYPQLFFPPYIAVQDGDNKPADFSARTIYATTVYAATTGHHTESSDRRLKKDIEPLPESLAKVMRLKPVSYRFIQSEDNRQEIGFIAQEVQEEFPDVVDEDGRGHLGIQYQRLTAPLVKAVQEQQALIEKLQKRLEELENKNGK